MWQISIRERVIGYAVGIMGMKEGTSRIITTAQSTEPPIPKTRSGQQKTVKEDFGGMPTVNIKNFGNKSHPEEIVKMSGPPESDYTKVDEEFFTMLEEGGFGSAFDDEDETSLNNDIYKAVAAPNIEEKVEAIGNTGEKVAQILQEDFDYFLSIEKSADFQDVASFLYSFLTSDAEGFVSYTSLAQEVKASLIDNIKDTYDRISEKSSNEDFDGKMAEAMKGLMIKALFEQVKFNREA